MTSKTSKKASTPERFNLKQLIHNDTERKRKKRMIEMIDKIVDLLPMKCVGKTSRISRLEQLYSYVLELRNKNDGLMFANPNSVQAQEISQLKKYIEHLEKTNKNYLKLLKLAGISAASAVEMGDRNWKKPLKYSNKVFLESKESATKMQDLVKSKKSKSSNDKDKNESSDDSSESSEPENKFPVKSETIQVINTLPLQQPQLQYVLLSTGPNAQAQLIPMICSAPIFPNNHQNVFLNTNITSAPGTSQTSTANLVHQDSSNNNKVNVNKKSTKAKKKNEKGNVEFLTNSKPPERPSKEPSSLTTTIERCEEDDSDDTVNNSATEHNESTLDNRKSVENKEQVGKRSSASEEQSIEANKKTKTSDSGQPTGNSTSQQSVNSNTTNVEKADLPGTRSKMLPSTSPVTIYQVEDDSNDSQIATPTNTGQSAAEKAVLTNSTSNRCNYSTESLLQLPGESQANSSQLNTSESRSNLNQQQSQQSNNPTDHTLAYHQQQPSVPSFTVKDSLMSNSSPIITSSSNSTLEKHNFDLSHSSVSSLCSKRNQPFENIEALGVSSSATTPNLFDPSIADNQLMQSSLVISSWPHEPSAASHSSAVSTNAFSGSQSYSNANASSVLFANQVPAPFSLLSTTPTSFDTSVPNAVFGSTSHKSLPPNPSSAFNFIPELNSIGSYSLANLDDQSSSSHQQNGSSIVDNFPRSSVSAAASSATSRATSNASRSNSSTAANTTVSSASTSSYSKQKSTTSAKASTTSTSASNTRSTKSSAATSKKSTTKLSSASAATSSTSAGTDPKFSQAASNHMSGSTASASANLFSRSHHHTHHAHHHSHTPTHPSHRPSLTNDAATSFPAFPAIITDPMTFLSVTSVTAGHSSSVMSTTTASSTAPPSFHSHAHPHHHHSHQPFPHSSYSNFFTPSQPSDQLPPPSYDNRSSYETANDPTLSSSSSHADLSDHNQLVNYPIFRPQPQASHTFVMPPTATSSGGGTSGSSYQPSASSSSSTHSRHNFPNPPMYPPHHHHQSSSSHITNFNIGCLLPDSTLSSSPGAYASSTSEFLSSTAKSGKSSHASSSASSMAVASSAPLISNSALPKIGQLSASKSSSLPQSVAAPPLVVDPFASSVSSYQNAAPGSGAHSSHQYHPATHPAFYPHAHPPPSQTSVTYSSSTHPLNPVSHFTSSSASQSRNSSVRNNSSFAAAADEVDSAAQAAASSGSSTRSSSLSAGAPHHYHHYHPHSEMFNPSVGGLGSAVHHHQTSGHHNQPLGTTHHLRQQHHFPPPPSNVSASTHNFNQSASAVPPPASSVANFNLQSSITSTSTAGPTTPHRLLSLNF